MSQPALKPIETGETGETWEEAREKKVVNLNGLNTTDKIIDALKSSEGEKPGRFLRQLRELEGLSVSQMATDIGLSTHQVTALENDDNDKLPAPIYVKGFIKRYCAAIGVPNEAILNAYDAGNKVNELSPILNRVSIKKKMHNDAAIMRWVGYALGLAFIALIVFWLQSLDFNNLFGGTTPGVDKPAELSLPVLEQPGADMAEPEKTE